MELIKITGDNGEVKCFLRCEEHGYFFNMRPPEPNNCDSCWMTYYMGQRAMMRPENMEQGLSELETAILHMQEEIAKGGFDLQLLDTPIIEIEKDAIN